MSAVLALLSALVASSLPLSPLPVQAQTAPPPVTAPPAPPAASLPPVDTTPPADHPRPDVAAPALDAAKAGPAGT
ncbi:MAG: hypothetical protein M3203_04625, partial [Actinomycetota bacterium]|nr:hypothetical protein [Actinomycetota bacterium]